MKFSLDASGAQHMGRSIGKLFQAAAMAPAMREQAKMDADRVLSTIYANNMTGNQRGAEALKTQQEATGLRLTNEARQAPIDDALPQYLQHAFKLFQATGDDNAERMAKAGQVLQSMGMTDKASQNVADLDMMNRWNTLAKPGETYLPFDNVGTTGYSMNKATGAAIEANPVLSKLFGQKNDSEVAENRAQAGSASASARNSMANADLTAAKLGHFMRTGQLPGSAGSGEDATNAKTRNAIIAAVEREMFGADDAEIMAEVDRRLARRSIPTPNKSPSHQGAGPKIGLPQGVTPDDALAQARAAIAGGKDREAVIQRLMDMGIDPKGL